MDPLSTESLIEKSLFFGVVTEVSNLRHMTVLGREGKERKKERKKERIKKTRFR